MGAHLNCPRCDWHYQTRNASWHIEYCPRCLAQAHRAVRLQASALGLKSGGRSPHRHATNKAA